MTDPLDFDGEDLQEALSQASASLGIPTGSLEYEVVQEARRGFLGVGGRGVRIRVRLSGEGSPDAEQSRGRTSGRAIPSPSGTPEALRIQAFLEAFVAASPFEITFRVTEDEEKIRVDLDGPDRELLLERRGEALQALQVLLGRVAAQGGSSKLVFVDCSDFRRNREEELVEIAHLVAEKVKRLGEPQSLSPMNPYERRLIHLTLKDDPDLETRSDGEGFLKIITIYPRRPSAAPDSRLP